jgi:hypothetical protein
MYPLSRGLFQQKAPVGAAAEPLICGKRMGVENVSLKDQVFRPVEYLQGRTLHILCPVVAFLHFGIICKKKHGVPSPPV